MINAVIAAVGVMLILSLSRVHVVIALIVGALVGGLTGGLGIDATLKAFNSGLGGGATVALSYALLGAFAVAIAKSGLAHALADKALLMVDRQHASGGRQVKWLLIGLLWVVAIASQALRNLDSWLFQASSPNSMPNRSWRKFSGEVFSSRRRTK